MKYGFQGPPYQERALVGGGLEGKALPCHLQAALKVSLLQEGWRRQGSARSASNASINARASRLDSGL